MLTSGGSWGITLLVALGMLLVLGLTLVLMVRSLRTRNLAVRCPLTRLMVVVQYVADETGHLTDVVTCSAFPDAQPITCGLPCLTGVPERPPADLLKV